MQSPSLVVLAAGMGSRYGSLKQMDAFGPNGENIIDYSIYDAIQAGFTKVVFVIRKSFEQDFRNFFSGKFEDQIAVEYIFQELDVLPGNTRVPAGREKPWGTGHAVWVTWPVINGPFAVINADDFYGRDAYFRIAEYFQSADAEQGNYAVVGYYLRNTLSDHGTVNRGVCSVDSDLYLRGVREVVKIARNAEGKISDPSNEILDEDTFVSMNIWGFLPSYYEYAEQSLLAFLSQKENLTTGELYIPAIVDDLISSGTLKVKVLPSESGWFGVTYKEDKPFVSSQINQLIASGEYPEKLWQ